MNTTRHGRAMRRINHKTDVCVIGGGLAGLCTAVAAARRGIQVILMHDRAVLGGNASSEIRMWICGAHGDNLRETGLIEEIELENRYRNPARSYAIWDSLLYEIVRFQPRLTLLLNCSCNQLEKREQRIRSVTGWQTTTQTWHTVEADRFVDCSGDSILAPLSGAPFRIGREAADEFGESIEPLTADHKTMGMSCLIQARETSTPQPFIAPAWAHRYTHDDQLPHRNHDIRQTNFWWLELGGEQDSIHDTEDVRDELLKHAFGVWDHIKNHGDHGAECWALDWIGFLPGKRESRRYEGDYLMTQNDVASGGPFDDQVAYGGWSMDDHHPGGLAYPGPPTIFHPAPSPFGIPYRCLYSRSIENLLFAGRNISVTHAAMSATRVMATCAILGQAVGTAAALGIHESLSPRDVGRYAIDRLQQQLLDDDCYLPGIRRSVPEYTQEARLTASAGDPEPLRNGWDRPCNNQTNAWQGPVGAWIQYTFPEPRHLRKTRIICDSDLNRSHLNMPCAYPREAIYPGVPETLIQAFTLEAQDPKGQWRTVASVGDNRQRRICLDLDLTTPALRLTPRITWGADTVRLFAWDVR